MAYNTKVTTTSTGKKIYYKGPYGDWDKNPDVPVEEAEADVPVEESEAEVPTSKKSKVLIWGALIAAALFLFK